MVKYAYSQNNGQYPTEITKKQILTPQECELIFQASVLLQTTTPEITRSVVSQTPYMTLIYGRSSFLQKNLGIEKKADITLEFNYVSHAQRMSDITGEPFFINRTQFGCPVFSTVRDNRTRIEIPFLVTPRLLPEGTRPVEKEADFTFRMLYPTLGCELSSFDDKREIQTPHSLARIKWEEQQYREFAQVAEVFYHPYLVGNTDFPNTLLGIWIGREVGIIHSD